MKFRQLSRGNNKRGPSAAAPGPTSNIPSNPPSSNIQLSPISQVPPQHPSPMVRGGVKLLQPSPVMLGGQDSHRRIPGTPSQGAYPKLIRSSTMRGSNRSLLSGGRGQGNMGPGSGGSQMGFISPITVLRENCMKKDNWNLFVGDNRYKTNFFLQFLDKSTQSLYERAMMPRALYSIRMMIAIMSLIENIRSLSLLALMISLFSLIATTKYAKRWPLKFQQLALMMMPMYCSYQVLTEFNYNKGLHVLQEDQNTTDNFKQDLLVSIAFFLPNFVMSIFILTSWLEYTFFSIFQALFVNLFFKYFHCQNSLEYIFWNTLTLNEQFSNRNSAVLWALSFYVIGFSLIEKVRKEQYVIGATNSKTKKMMIQLMNQVPNPIALISKKGQIMFCNQQFETLLSRRLGFNSMPQSLYKLINEEEASGIRLKTMIEDVIKPVSGQTGAASEKIQKLEIRLIKQGVRAQQGKPSPQLGATINKSQESMNETRSNLEHRHIQSQKDVFGKYEMVEIKADSIVFNSQKVAMLTFTIVSEQKAKNQLLFLNSQILVKFLNTFNKKLYNIYEKVKEDESKNQDVIEYIGSTYFILNKIQQIQHELVDQKDFTQSKLKEDFFLKDEIVQIVESLSVGCLTSEATLKLDATTCLPEKLSGDVGKFRLALSSVIEFVTRYTKEGQIDFIVNFDGFTAEQQYNISFDLRFNRNPQFNEEPLIRMLNNIQRNKGGSFDETMLHNYEEFFDLICHFGIGIILFPTLIHSIGGTYNISIHEPSPNSLPNDNKSSNCLSLFSNMNGGPSDSSRYMESNPNINPNDTQQVKPNRKIKIFFIITFDHAELTRKATSPYLPFNPYKEENNGKSVYKSPLIKKRQVWKKAVDDMKKIMELSKSPAPQGRQINVMSSQISPFSGIIPPRKPNIPDAMMLNGPGKLNVPEGGSNEPFNVTKVNPQVPVISISKPAQNKTTEEKEKNKVSRRATDGCAVGNQGQEQNQKAKKVENGLLDFEKKQPSKVEFFKVQKIASIQKISDCRATGKSESNGKSQISPKQNQTFVIPLDVSGDKSISGANIPIIPGGEVVKTGDHIKEIDIEERKEIVQKVPNNNIQHESNQSFQKMNSKMEDDMAEFDAKIGKVESDLKGINSQNPSLNHSNFLSNQAVGNFSKKSSNGLLTGPVNVNSNSHLPKASSHVNSVNKSRRKSLFVKVSNLNEVQENDDDELFSTLKVEQNDTAKGVSNLPGGNENPVNNIPVTQQASPGSFQVHNSNQSPIKKQVTIPFVADNSVSHLTNLIHKDKIEDEKKDLTNRVESFGNTQKNDISQSDQGQNQFRKGQNSKESRKEQQIQHIEEIKVKEDRYNINANNIQIQIEEHVDEQDNLLLGEGLENFDTDGIHEYDSRFITGVNIEEAKHSKIEMTQNNDVMRKSFPHDLMNIQSLPSASKNLLVQTKNNKRTENSSHSEQIANNVKVGNSNIQQQPQSMIIIDKRGPQSHSTTPQKINQIIENNTSNFAPQSPELSVQNQINDRTIHQPSLSAVGNSKAVMTEQEVSVAPQVISNSRPQFVFPYKRSQKIQQYQLKLNQIDLSTVESLTVWNKDLEEQMKKKKEEEQRAWNEVVAQGGKQAGPLLQGVGAIQIKHSVNIDPSKKYVLVVEDNPMISMILEESLQTMGISAVVAENGKIAVDKFNEFLHKGYLFELILMDIIMPEMGGYDATQLIRKSEEIFKLRDSEKHFICGFSANVNPETKKKCQACGMNDILSKPMKTEFLKEMVDKNNRKTNKILKGTGQQQTVDQSNANNRGVNLPLMANAQLGTVLLQSDQGTGTPQQRVGANNQADMNDLTILPSRVQAHS